MLPGAAGIIRYDNKDVLFCKDKLMKEYVCLSSFNLHLFLVPTHCLGSTLGDGNQGSAVTRNVDL